MWENIAGAKRYSHLRGFCIAVASALAVPTPLPATPSLTPPPAVVNSSLIDPRTHTPIPSTEDVPRIFLCGRRDEPGSPVRRPHTVHNVRAYLKPTCRTIYLHIQYNSSVHHPECVRAYSKRVFRTNCALRIKKCAPRISSGIYFLSLINK